MALVLPRIHVDLTGSEPRARADRGAELGPGELTGLISLDRGKPPHHSERCLALGGRRWAVGRRLGDQVIWRLVDEAAVRSIDHPAWLWTRDAWFDLDRPPDRPGPTPAALPLRTVLSGAAPTSTSGTTLIRAVGAALGAWRRYLLEGDAPVAIVVPESATGPGATAARSLALTLLRCLPPEQRAGIRLAVGAQAPDPATLDLVICAHAPADYQVIHAPHPPTDTDHVAFFIENRLQAADTESVEAVAVAGASLKGDGWGEAVRARLRDRVAGLTEIDPALLDSDPEEAVRRVAARLSAGVPIDEEVQDQLVQVTLRTSDPRAWASLGDRPAVARARAVQALLPHANALQPKGPLIRVIGALYPPGAPVEPWLDALMHWFEQGSPDALDLLERTLVEWPSPATRARRATLWADVIRALARDGRHEEAGAALQSGVCRALAREGEGQRVARFWHLLPGPARTPEAMKGLVALLSEAEDVRPAVHSLFREVSDAPALVIAMLEAWSEHRPSDTDDPLTDLIRDASFLSTWMERAEQTDRLDELGRLATAVQTGPDDPLWSWLAERLAERHPEDPRRHLVALAHLTAGLGTLEPQARSLLPSVLKSTSYPDPALAWAAHQLCEHPDSAPLWPWIAICAAPPDHFDEATVDATTVAFCEVPPTDRPSRDLARRSAYLLGMAAEVEIFDHARWIVRLILAPDDGTGFHLALATSLVQGLAVRPDATSRMTQITHLLLELEPSHPALATYFHALLPHAWLGGLPRMFIDAVDTSRMRPPVSQAWAALAQR